MVKFFKPGDRVQKKSGGPVMVVQRYGRTYNPWVGWSENGNFVECTWYDLKLGYQKEIIHQMNLMKVPTTKKRTEQPSGIKMKEAGR